jgi:signal transduction histidine kinase
MSQFLSLLLVEDSEDDALLLTNFLEEGGYTLQSRRIETPEQFRLALDERSWDLIVADYNLPRFSGLAALAILKERDLDIPFILVSGAIGEETAVTALKSGAHDFLLKDKLARLVPAVTRELNEAKNRKNLREAEAEREQLLQALAEAKELAELANQRKSKVLAFVAHEFKNPLKAVSTFSELLCKESLGPLNEQQKEYVTHINTACEHLRELINDILDIAPIEAGIIELHPQRIHLHTLLEDVKTILQDPAAQKQVTLHFQIQDGIDYLTVDPKRFRQILINLLSNAVKYTVDNDNVILAVQVNRLTQQVEIQVTDHGPGIPPGELKNLFQDYYRVRNKLTAQKEGLGLGLALTKKLVELHGGNITVASTLGSGTCFELVLPIRCLEPLASQLAS